MYDFVVDLIGTIPAEFEFVYSIITCVLAMLIIGLLFYIFYIPIEIISKR